MSFATAMNAALPAGMHYPVELHALFNWLEAEGHVKDGRAGLTPPGVHPHKYDEKTDRLIVSHGTDIHFFPQEGPWGALPPQRVHVFARSGGDGSRLALWKDDAGECRVVHLGSGSGSVWWGCVGETPLDLLRLLAIGYPEIAFPEQFSRKPQELKEIEFRAPNAAYQAWVTATFDVAIPEYGTDICPKDPCWDDESSEDPFWQYLDANRG